ncbi:hypothetical protein ZWY2020_047860 [Hordeum vulgare]|nr:hypothetical protein ZWY2020_047860 [Hordeum vulgare]
MNFLLTLKYGFQSDSVLVLTDEERDPYRRPTRSNILVAMRWLVHGCSSGDSLVFTSPATVIRRKTRTATSRTARRGHLPARLAAQRRHPGRRDQRGHRPPARAGRHAPRHHRRLPQRHRTGNPSGWITALQMARKNTSSGHAILISGCTDDEDAQDGYSHETMAMGADVQLLRRRVVRHRTPTYGQLLSKTKAILADCNRDSQNHCDLLRPSCRTSERW